MAYQCLDTAIRTIHFVRVVRDKRDVTVSAVVINLLWLTIIQLPKIVVMDGGSGWMVTRVLLGYLQYLDEVAVSKDDFWFMHSTFARRALLGTFTRDTKSVDRIRVIKRRHTKQPVGIYVCFASLASIHPALTHTFLLARYVTKTFPLQICSRPSYLSRRERRLTDSIGIGMGGIETIKIFDLTVTLIPIWDERKF